MVGIDVDPQMVAAAEGECRSLGIAAKLQAADYLRWEPGEQFDAAVLNPPYLRQEWIDDKAGLRAHLERACGVAVPGTANLYVYFLVKALNELRPGGRLAAITYDAWTYTRYGRWLRSHLQEHCANVDVEIVSDSPFHGRMIDATIIHAEKSRSGRPVPVTAPEQARGGESNRLLRPIGDLYESRRGLRLKQTSFFLCDTELIGGAEATRFVKHIRHVGGYEVSNSHPQAALLIPQGDVDHPAMPELRRRLRAARDQPEGNKSILAWADQRPAAWYSHPLPPRAPILFNYYMRNSPRHLYNPGMAYADNFYGLTPRHGEPPFACLAALNSSIASRNLLSRSRNQGSGLRKIQLYEYREVLTPAVHLLPAAATSELEFLGRTLCESPDPTEVIARIDAVLSAAFASERQLPPAAHGGPSRGMA